MAVAGEGKAMVEELRSEMGVVAFMNRVRRLIFGFGYFALFIVFTGVDAFPQANGQGQWSILPYTMPINPIHAALLNNGKVLVVAGSGNNPLERFQAAVWDPQSGNITALSLGWDMFCNGMIVLPDGRPLIDGGTIRFDPSFEGSANGAVFDPVAGQFTDLPAMADGRWYPTVTVLPDGTVLAFSGLTAAGSTNTKDEIFSPSTWSWSKPNAAGWGPPLYPRMHVLPNGNVFESGPNARSRYYYPATHTWSPVVATTNYASTRTHGSSVLLPLTPANNYKPVVMILGGGGAYATATTERIDLSAAIPTWQWGPSMSEPRIEMNAVLLPSGKVLALGGSGVDENASTASYNADLYDPANNTFSPAGKNAIPRLYHSTAILLPDATVWLAGSNPKRGTYEPRMEWYQPAYLFDSTGNLAVRPTVASAPSFVNYGQTFAVATPDAADIASVVLIKPGAVTHAFDMDQRLVGLSYTAGLGTLSVTAPPNSNLAPPGYYMLFLLNSSGVPSMASFIQMSTGPDFSITPSPPRQVILPGQNTSYNIQTYPSGGFAGTVNLSVSGVPTGFNGSFTNNTFNLNASNLNPSSLPQSYTMTVKGTSETLTRTSPLQLLINSPGDFSLSASPSPLNIIRGGAGGQVVVTLTPSGGFVGVTTFTISGLPAHVTATFTPSSISSGSTTLTLTASSTALAGTYTGMITGTSGTLVHSTPVTVTLQ